MRYFHSFFKNPLQCEINVNATYSAHLCRAQFHRTVPPRFTYFDPNNHNARKNENAEQKSTARPNKFPLKSKVPEDKKGGKKKKTSPARSATR